MRRFSLISLVSSLVVLLMATFAATATASDDRQYTVELRNTYYGECLAYYPGQAVQLAPCGESPFTLWDVNVGYVDEIRSVVTGQCLTDVDTNNMWGGVAMRDCEGAPRQLWGSSPDGGLVQNLATARFLKANHDRIVYAGDLEHYYPRWDVRG